MTLQRSQSLPVGREIIVISSTDEDTTDDEQYLPGLFEELDVMPGLEMPSCMSQPTRKKRRKRGFRFTIPKGGRHTTGPIMLRGIRAEVRHNAIHILVETTAGRQWIHSGIVPASICGPDLVRDMAGLRRTHALDDNVICWVCHRVYVNKDIALFEEYTCTSTCPGGVGTIWVCGDCNGALSVRRRAEMRRRRCHHCRHPWIHLPKTNPDVPSHIWAVPADSSLQPNQN